MLQQTGRPPQNPGGAWPAASEYERIVAEVLNSTRGTIGCARYFVRSQDAETGELYRLAEGSGGSEPGLERVDIHAIGIEPEDLEASLESASEFEACPGLYHISAVVERKLRALEDDR